uniref:transmembrane protein 128 isoform X1 n=1 Tax=Myxine glutinosa TaxID=7769 RepID=UPI0035902C48
MTDPFVRNDLDVHRRGPGRTNEVAVTRDSRWKAVDSREEGRPWVLGLHSWIREGRTAFCILLLDLEVFACSAGPDGVGTQERVAAPPRRINLHAAFWVCAASAVTFYTDFFMVLFTDLRVDSWWLKFGISLLCLSLSIACYCIVYLEWFRKLPDYDNYNPYLVPISTASFIAGGFCLMVALWPVWSVATPVILLTQFLGLVMFISLLG